MLAALARPLAAHSYLRSRGYPAADVLVGATVSVLPGLGLELPAALADYVARLAERPAFGAASAA